ncbi:MAG: Gfo/Idh/MocA family protein [Bryobacteraceae bacterium]
MRVAVVGAGAFGRHHLRVLKQSPNAELAAVVDSNAERAQAAAAEFDCVPLSDARELSGSVDAAVIAAPTSLHAEIGCMLLSNGIDLLIEKPIAADRESGEQLLAMAERHGCILQIGHLERFNPAVAALEQIAKLPLFFEVHRLSLFSPRSLDVDVVLDLMIHDLDIVLHLVGETPSEVRAAGLKILSDKVDIASVRLAFPGGCIANLTASRVSTERVRKLRLFQPHQYVSLDYERQQIAAFTVSADRRIGFENVAVDKQEPLWLEVESFLHSIATREPPLVSGRDGLRALDTALDILDKIEEHTRLVGQRLRSLP